MSANIFGDRFAGHREPAWHEIGQVFTDPISASEAVKLAKLDFTIEKYPLSCMTSNGQLQIDKVAILRDPTSDDPEYRVLGIATPSYEIIQNSDIAATIDPLTQKWPVESIGALGKGETMFLALDAGPSQVKDDPVHQYFLITDTKDGGTSMRIAFTPVRVVCQNTLVSGLQSAITSASLTHSGRAQSSLEVHVSLLRTMQDVLETTMAKFEALADAAISQKHAAAIFAAAYPKPNRPKKAYLVDDPDSAEALGELYDEATSAQEEWEYYVERALAFRDGAKTLFEKLNDEHPQLAMTAWHAYNAVVECADFRNGGKSMFESALFGSRAAEKARAFTKALEYVSA